LGGLTQTNCKDYSEQYKDREALVDKIHADMKSDGWSANIWYQDDHGGMTLLGNHKITGYAWRLSAPGYLDCTDWADADTLLDAVKDCLSVHGDGFDEQDYRDLAAHLEGFDDFLEGYLLGLAFTGHRYATEDSEPEPLYSNPDGQIADVVDTNELFDNLSDKDRLTVLGDCLDFLASCHNLIFEMYHDAGNYFHLTRNRHGAGFWDDDWPTNGDKLTELSHSYSTSELTAFGDDAPTLTN
jgi:hypothetical protein